MCMFVICMLCTEKRKDAGGYANKTVTHMPVTKKRHSTSASYSSATSTASNSSTTSTGTAAYGAAAAAAAAARLIPLGNVTCNIMGATSTVPVHTTTLAPHNVAAAAAAAAHIAPTTTTTSLASIKYNIVQKSVSPAVMFQELPPRYRAWL